MRNLKIGLELLKNLKQMPHSKIWGFILLSLAFAPVYAKDKPIYSLGGKYLGVATDDGYLIDLMGKQRGYITPEGQYLDSKAHPQGYLEDDRLYNNTGHPIDFDYNN